jgi:hypothetical protein
MLTNEQFQEKLKQIDNGITTDTFYAGNDTFMNCNCKYGHHFTTKAFNLIYNKNGCPVCSGRQVDVGVNDMWTTNPKQAELLLDPDDGYKYSQCSQKKVWWKCPCCGLHINKKIQYVNQRGLICHKCGDGISFPNKFMYNILSQLNIDFQTEYMIEGQNYRYDFYIPSFSLIIEMQGKQHYDGWNSKQIKKEDIQLNDKNKREYALLSGIKNYIEIDAKETNKNYLKDKILQSNLSTIFNLTYIDWESCLLYSVKSFVSICADYYNLGLSTQEISDKIHCSLSSVVKWLKTATELELCHWIPSKGFLEEEKPVVCITTNKKYDSISDAARDTNQDLQNISNTCKRKRNYCGVDKNGNPMIWRYLDEYDPTEDFSNIKINTRRGVKVNQYTLDDIFLKTYSTIKSAQDETNSSSISLCCRKLRNNSGNYKWFYASDPSQPDKSKIIPNQSSQSNNQKEAS